MAGSHLQNSSNLNPTRATKKSGQILQKQAGSNEISTKSREISTKSGYIWWDLARSDQTQQFLAKKKCIFQKKSSFLQEFFNFRRNFPDSSENFQFLAKISDSDDAFFSDFDAFLISATDPTQPTLTITENRTDRFFRRSVSGYSAPPSDAGGSSPGWVKNRPGPTREQPYKQ